MNDKWNETEKLKDIKYRAITLLEKYPEWEPNP
jgi:hypothetical protein